MGKEESKLSLNTDGMNLCPEHRKKPSRAPPKNIKVMGMLTKVAGGKANASNYFISILLQRMNQTRN